MNFTNRHFKQLQLFCRTKLFIIFFIITILSFIVLFIMFRTFFEHKKLNSAIFSKIYLINLVRRPDRLKNFLTYFNASDLKNFNLTKFDAIDGTKLDQENIPLSELATAELQQLKTTGFRTKHYQLTMGAIGCYLSHVKVWEHILKNDSDVVLIFEDDAKIPENFLSEVNENIAYIPNDWDIILLGYLCKKCYEFQKYKEVERFQLTHAYLIKKTAIIKIMNSDTLFPITQQIDALMSELSSIINIYSLKNKIVPQFQSRTDIQAPMIDKKLRDKLNININDRIKVL